MPAPGGAWSLCGGRRRGHGSVDGIFFRAHLEENLSPAAALQQAQLELREQGWDAAYYWAAFIRQGEWRPAATAGPPAAAQEISPPI